jgi:hypothetical protein
VTITRRFAAAAILVVICVALPGAQGGARRLTTVEALRQFPGYFHLQNVLVHGEFAEDGRRLRAGDTEIRVQFAPSVSAVSGPVEVRGQLVDIGRLESGDPRAVGLVEGRDAWPRPGEEMFLQVTGVATPTPFTGPSLRALALEPWRYAGQTVTVTGNFRGRNLFGDLPDAPGKGRYDFIVRGGEGSVWVTGTRPRGSGFDFDVDRRVDSNRWLQVSGPLVVERGLVRIEATRVSLARAPERVEADSPDEGVPAAPKTPADVVFHSPTDGETDVTPTSPVRVQFSKGLNEASLTGRVRATYVGGPPAADGGLALKTSYDAANRAIEIRFAQPLEAFRTVKVELLDGITAFDGGPVVPWAVTFSVGN